VSVAQHITSRDNPLLVKVRKLSRDAAAYRKLGEIWLEGEHLCHAAVQRRATVSHALVSEDGWQDPLLRELAESAPRVSIVAEPLFHAITSLESPARLGFVVPLEPQPSLEAGVASVVLDRLQDPGNVGTIVRTAAALGVTQVLALKGTAALWSPKVLRAGMGSHLSVHLIEGLDAADLDGLRIPLIATSSHAPQLLHQMSLPAPCAWLFGHEGQGIDAALMQRCELQVRILQPGGEESLNVASAAAICLYESARQRAARS
jgi:TrmH family RNA methyltransferase